MGNPLQEALDVKKIEEVKPLKKKGVETQQKINKPEQENKKSDRSTVMIGGQFSREVHKQLKILAAEEELTVHQLLEEAINLLLVKKGKKKIEDIV